MNNERESTRINKLKAIEQFIVTAGNVVMACENAYISRSQFYKWKKDDQEFNETINSCLKNMLRFYQNQLLIKVIKGDLSAIKKSIKKIQKQIA
jgi:ACT domain-containing protein